MKTVNDLYVEYLEADKVLGNYAEVKAIAKSQKKEPEPIFNRLADKQTERINKMMDAVVSDDDYKIVDKVLEATFEAHISALLYTIHKATGDSYTSIYRKLSSNEIPEGFNIEWMHDGYFIDELGLPSDVIESYKYRAFSKIHNIFNNIVTADNRTAESIALKIYTEAINGGKN